MNHKSNRGFSLIELLLTMTVFSVLIGLVTINFTSVQRKTTLNTTLETLLTDFSQQQIKAMVGDTEGRSTNDNYGIHFSLSSYTLFHGAYSTIDSSNFTITLPPVQSITTTFPNSEIIFDKGTGNFLNYQATQSAVTINDTVSGDQKTIKFNRYGVITSIN